MSRNRRMLLAFAHPDDESFGTGALIAKYVSEGVEVSLICTTNGDSGSIPDDMGRQYDSIAELRLSELDCAAKKLGFHKVYTFGYSDSGMMGAETNNLPDASWFVWRNRKDEMLQQVVRVIREVRPQVVVTFNRYGGYGHPDHIAIQQATTEAFFLAADPEYMPNSLPPYQAQKLYYTSIPSYLIRVGIWRARWQGMDPRKLGMNQDIDLVAVLDNVEPVHTRIDIHNYLDDWNEANACHASQGGGRSGFLPRWLRRLPMMRQGLTRVFPQPSTDRVDESDLFDNVAATP